MQQLVAYMKAPGGVGGAQGISWGYWDWNPTSGDTGGILEDDWATVDPAKIAAITPGFYHAADSTTVLAPSGVDFTVTLSAASTKTVTIAYATKDGTAHAGTNYTATSGTLTFAPGTTSEIVAVHLLGSAATSKLTFMLALSDPSGHDAWPRERDGDACAWCCGDCGREGGCCEYQWQQHNGDEYERDDEPRGPCHRRDWRRVKWRADGDRDGERR